MADDGGIGVMRAGYVAGSADQSWMRPVRIRYNGSIQSPHVVRAENVRRGPGEGEVDQRLMSCGFSDLVGRSSGPDWLADKPKWLSDMGPHEGPNSWNDRARIPAELRHVRERHPAGIAVQYLLQQ